MRRSAAISVGLHVAVLLAAYFGLPSLFSRPQALNQPIVVEVFTIAEETAAPPPAPAAPPEPTKAPKTAEKDFAKAEPTPPPPPAPKPTPPEAKVEPAPPPPPPAPTIDPEPVPQAKPVPPPEPKPAPPEPPQAKAPEPQPEPAPAPTPARKPKPPRKADPFASVLKSVAELERKAEPERELALRAPTPAPTPAPPAARPAQSLTLSEIDAIRQQIQRNWSLNPGVRDAENLVVTLRITLLRDGSVQRVEVVDAPASGGSDVAHWRAAAESARRAVLKSSPLRVPADKYELWRDITLTFNPKDML